MSGEDSPKITSILIIEIMGRPKEHIVETLKQIIEQMKKEPGTQVVDSKVHEPNAVQNQKDMFLTFGEIEVETNNFSTLAGLMFKYMPSHVDVIEPENLQVTNKDLSEMMSEVIRKLHGYDEIARVLQAQKDMLERRLAMLEKEKQDSKK